MPTSVANRLTTDKIDKSLLIFDPSVDLLVGLLEEGARASKQGTTRFIEPMQGTLRRAQNKRHHLIFGRRGSGKSSLLYRSVQSLDESGAAIAFVDLEPFKGQLCPDVIYSCLISAFSGLQNWISKHQPEGEDVPWYERWHSNPTNKWRIRAILLRRLNSEIQALKHALQDTHQPADDTAGLTKSAFLEKKILDYQKIFLHISHLTDTSSFLFFDDFYHINRSQQPYLLDYFHRIAKGNKLWLKIGTIKHRSTWYLHTPQPTGMKTADDADEIDLDLTLEHFSTSKHFLQQVLDAYIRDAHAPLSDQLLSPGALDRLVIASGGVTRDFLGLFRRAVDEARERLTLNPGHNRGVRIAADDINTAAGDYGAIKREEFQQDTLDDQGKLDRAFQQLCSFCLDQNKANIFLIDQENKNKTTELIQELVDLRLIHHVKSRVTISSRPGRVFRALLLDVSQYTGERKRRDVEIIEFWKDNRDSLRKANLIYDLPD